MSQLDLSFHRFVNVSTYEKLLPSHRLIYRVIRPEIMLLKFTVIDLSLRGNFLLSIPKEIFSFQKLQKLDLSENEGISLEGIYQFQLLKELRAEEIGLKYCNELTRLCDQLHLLDISQNQIEIIPQCFLRIPICYYDHNPLLFDPLQCEAIDLQDKQLKCLPNELIDITTVNDLNLSENPHINVSGISCLQSIEELNLQGCKLQWIHYEIFTLQQLHSLTLDNNLLEYIPADIARLVSLQALNLEKNKLHFIPKEICYLPNLSMLNISDNQLITLPDEFDILFKRRIHLIFTENLFQIFSPYLEECCVEYVMHNLNKNDREWLQPFSNKEILQKVDIYVSNTISPFSFMNRFKPPKWSSSIPSMSVTEDIYTDDSENHFQTHFAFEEIDFENDLPQVEVEYNYDSLSPMECINYEDEMDFNNDMFL